MGRHADFSQAHHQMLGNSIVEHTLAGNRRDFTVAIVEVRVVLKILHKGTGLGAFVDHLALAFVYSPAPRHRHTPKTEKFAKPTCAMM